jgi:Ataxin-3
MFDDADDHTPPAPPRRSQALQEAHRQLSLPTAPQPPIQPQIPADIDDEDDEPPAPPRAVPPMRQHRVLDDEDAELQAALRASLEGLPEGFEVPEFEVKEPTGTSGVLYEGMGDAPRTQGSRGQPQASRHRNESDDDGDDDDDDEGGMGAAPSTSTPTSPGQVSMDEIRRRRLARFGG